MEAERCIPQSTEILEMNTVNPIHQGESSFITVLSETHPSAAAEEIMAAAEDSSMEPPSLIAEFDVSGGVMQGKGKGNTWIRFDSSSGCIRKIIDAMESAVEVTTADVEAFDRWRGDVSRIIEHDHLIRLQNILRMRILGGAPQEAFPLNSVSVIDLDISDLPDNDCVLVVKKQAPRGESSPPVSEDIFSEISRTGEEPDQVVQRRRSEGDDRYRWVVGVEARKHFFEVTVTISADYSSEPLEE
jgi:hypothetical protein